VMLFQKRIAPNIFGYIAAKRGKVKRVVWHGCYDPNRSKYALAA